jgi:hypothetical protein
MRKRLLTWACILALSMPCYGQRPVPSEQDIADVIALYRGADIKTFHLVTHPVKDKEPFYQSLNPAFHSRLVDPRIIGKLKKILRPVLSLYKKDFDLVIAQSDIPIVMNHGGVILVITTGMLKQIESDDELLGYVAHEIGHEFLIDYWEGCNYLLNSHNKNDVLHRKFALAMALIELQCDAFAALTLSYLNYDPTAFIQGLERLDKVYGEQENLHPHVSIRRMVVEGVSHLSPKPRVTEGLKELKKQLADYK